MNRIWNETTSSNSFGIYEHAPMPRGAQHKRCPKCLGPVLAVVICRADGGRVIESSDQDDPNFVCTSCGFWWD
jgi:hypothetical protein